MQNADLSWKLKYFFKVFPFPNAGEDASGVAATNLTFQNLSKHYVKKIKKKFIPATLIKNSYYPTWRFNVPAVDISTSPIFHICISFEIKIENIKFSF